MLTPDLRQKLRDLLEPAIGALGFDLVAVELVGGQRRQVLRLSIDKPGGVGADDCARVSHRISPLLDEADPIDGPYDLEVSSPGIERPVQRLSDFVRFVGYRVRVRMEEGFVPAGAQTGRPRRRFTGTVVRVDGDDVHVEVDGQVVPLPGGAIDSAHLVLELDDYMKLAQGLPPLPDADGDSQPAGTHGAADGADQEER